VRQADQQRNGTLMEFEVLHARILTPPLPKPALVVNQGEGGG
jgi:hypothetical protein